MQLKIEIFDRLFEYSVLACDSPREFTIGFKYMDMHVGVGFTI